MHTIDPSLILIKPDRQRRDFPADEALKLSDSIRNIGLLHPPILRQEGDSLVLVAGERRLRAVMDIFSLDDPIKCCGETFHGVIPYLPIGELSEIEAEEAELDENLRRKNLTWQEEAAAMARLHNLRAQQKLAAARAAAELDRKSAAGSLAAKATGAAPAQKPAPLQSFSDTATEIFGAAASGSRVDVVRKSVLLANHLDNPLVAKAKNVNDAFKLIRREEQRRIATAAAIEIGKSASSDRHTLLQGDCLVHMAQMPAERFDVILTDPPYGMNAQDFGDSDGRATATSHNYDDSPEAWLALMSAWAPLSYTVAKAQAHAYVFCDIANFPTLKTLMEEAGWYVFRTPLIYHRPNQGRVPLPDRGPRRCWEAILYAIKGKRQTNGVFSDVITVDRDAANLHGAQKPVALLQNLLSRSVTPGDRVLDTFAGTGAILTAGDAYKCEVTAIEQDPASFALCVERLRSLDTVVDALSTQAA